MKIKGKYIGILIAVVFLSGFIQNASARDLIVVASKPTQEVSKDWIGFLRSKEIPLKIITPDSFSRYSDELYIVILGSVNESNEIAELAKHALTSEEFQSLAKNSQGKMFYKPQAWNIGQKVILFLGPNQEAMLKARKSTRNEWMEMLMEWFDIEDAQSFYVY